MRVGPIAHGALLVAALGFAYQTWTREPPEEPKAGTITVWNEPVESFESLAYDGENKSLVIERRGEGDDKYLWGTVTRSRPKPKPKVPVKNDDPEKMAREAAEAADAHGHGPLPIPGRPNPPAGGKDKAGDKEPGADKKPGADDKKAGADKAAAGDKKPAADKKPSAAGKKPAADKKPASGDKKAGAGTPAGPKSPHHTEATKPAADPVDTSEEDKGTADGADESTDATSEPEEPEMEVTTKEFPVGTRGEKLIENLSHLRALRDLGVLKDDQKAEYGLDESKETVTVFFKGGKKHSLILGDKVIGGSDRYALDTDTGRAYVLSASEVTRSFDTLENGLGLRVLHAFMREDENEEDDDLRRRDPSQPKPKRDKYRGVEKVTLSTPSSVKQLVRSDTTDTKGETVLGWALADTPDKPDLSYANFLSQLERLKPIEYDTTLDPKSLTQLLKVEFRSGGGELLGTFELFKRQKVSLEVATSVSPALEDKDKKDEVEYYVRTELTRIPGRVSKMTAERVVQDIPQIVGGGADSKGAKDEGAKNEGGIKGAAPATPAKTGDAPAKPAEEPAKSTAAPAKSSAAPAKTGGAAAKPAAKKTQPAGAKSGAPAKPAGSEASRTPGNK